MSSSGGYRRDIDGLRAVAVLAVLAYHAFPGKVPHGYLGVDVFFVISGFLITGLLVRERDAGGVDLAGFYARRVRRLFPSLLLVLAFVLAAGFSLMLVVEFQRLGRHVLASLAFVQNLNLAAETGYFDTAARAKPLLHLWSLAIEEQFYILWPAALVLVLRWPRAATALAAGVVVASLALAVSGVVEPDRAFYALALRAWELGIGALLALVAIQAPGRTPGRRWRDAASVVALAGLGLFFLVLPWADRHPGLGTVLPVLATAVLIAAGPDALANRWVLARREAVFIGLISYPLYLWHWPLLSFPFLILGETPPAWMRLAALAASFALAWASWRFVERPLRFNWSQRRSVAVLATLAGLIALLSLALPPIQGQLRGPREAQAERLLSGPFWRFTRNPVCEARHGLDYRYFCIQNRPGEPTVMLLGNSFANHLYPGLVDHPAMRDAVILSYGHCDPSGVMGRPGEDCARQDAILAASPRLRTIVVGAVWPGFDASGRMIDGLTGSRAGYETAPTLADYEAGLTQRLRPLARRGLRIVIFGPKADLGYDAADCYPRPLRPATRDCRIARPDADRQTDRTLAMLRRVVDAVPGATLIDVRDRFCDARECVFIDPEGLPLLRDMGHYSELGSRRAVAAWLGP